MESFLVLIYSQARSLLENERELLIHPPDVAVAVRDKTIRRQVGQEKTRSSGLAESENTKVLMRANIGRVDQIIFFGI